MKKYLKKLKLIVYLCVTIILAFSCKITTVEASVNTSLPSMVCIDNPKANSNVSSLNNQLSITGWSLNAQGVQKVQIYLDNVYKLDAAIGQTRPDVNKVYPGYYGGANSGYVGNADITALSYGAHTVTVKSIGNDGAVSEASAVIFKVPNSGKQMDSMVCIDNPKANSNVSSLNNQLSVTGWSLNGYGVQKVQIYLDNVYKSDAAIGQVRADVNKVYPGYYGGANSGYSGSIDISNVSDGTHTISVKSAGNDGNIKTESVMVNKVSSKSMPGRICIDSPNNNSIVSSNQIKVAGWSLNVYGVKTVQLYLDGNYKADLATGSSRPDVDRVFPNYCGGANSGYAGNADITALSYGTHTVTVKSMGNDGAVSETDTVIFKVPDSGKQMDSIMSIDNPKNNTYAARINNQLSVTGWSINGYGVQRVQIYLDNVYKSDATIGQARADVSKVFSGYYGVANSGYSGSIDISNVSEGTHTITVKSIGNDGVIKCENVNINKVTSKSVAPKVDIDTPGDYKQVSNNTLDVSGWSLNVYGVQKVQIFVDNNYMSDAVIGGLRPDVDKAMPGYIEGINSGYSGSVDITSLSAGTHVITVKSIGLDGSVGQADAHIFKLSGNVNSMPGMVCIDAPSDGTFIKNDAGQIEVRGWALDAFGVNKIQVYVDNIYKGDASLGILRPDVNNTYPNYAGGGTSGFSYYIDLSAIADGVHTININSIGNDSVSTQKSVRVYKFSGNNRFITTYNISLQDMVTKQINYGEPVMDSNGNWVSADRNTVQYYVDPFNFMDSYGIYQFLRLDYIQGISADDLNKILSGKGVLIGKGQQFLNAAQQSNINPIYLVAHALLETGNGTSALATGINVNGVKVYNLFGIHAYDSDANYYGSQYAYSQNWTSVDSAIYGGANWISSWYINNNTYKQNTLYKMRWNPASPTNHQYATDVKWAYNQVYYIKKLTDMCANPILQFDIPQYK